MTTLSWKHLFCDLDGREMYYARASVLQLQLL